ncbi:MAG: 16S rRNA (cytosine(1402)-N(4))-methyltransferase RsmH [Anaerolineae bacterium]|nr:16S rRNA (cytosine(1402)-N(4))-methyltransferase RsmH [Anaerolineae bacterium]
MNEERHIPVLLAEVLAGLNVQTGGRYLDATIGGAGHAQAILDASAPTGQLLGLDRDPDAASRAAARLACFGARAQVIHASYVQLAQWLDGAPWVDGVLFDLGFSSWQVDDPERGFSFREDGPLDMRFDPSSDVPTAAELVNQYPMEELVSIIRQYGEEPQARRIVQAIVTARPICSTKHLADVVASVVHYAPRHSRMARHRGTSTGAGERHSRMAHHPATRTFQALRIAVNHELESLETALPQAVAVLRPGGRLAVITFHSLEDRLVKSFFRQAERGCICPPESPVCVCGRKPSLRAITRKPIVPSKAEVEANPRSRSAKLRVAEKL